MKRQKGEIISKTEIRGREGLPRIIKSKILSVNDISTCGQAYKHFTLVNYDSRVVIWAIF